MFKKSKECSTVNLLNELINNLTITFLFKEIFFKWISPIYFLIFVKWSTPYPIENKDEVIKYSYHVDINICDCARQVIEDVEQSTDIIFNEVNEGIELFDRYLETLKLIIKTQKTKLDPNEDSRLKQNLTIIEEYESALERFMAFRRTVSHAFIKDMSQEERKTYEELQEQLDTAAKKFQ